MPRTTQQLLNLTPGQMTALVGTNLGEAGHTAKDQQLVGLTVLGRTLVPGYGKTPTDVGWAPNQFVANAGINRAQAEDPNYWIKRYGAKQYQERLGLLNNPNALLGAVNSYGVPLSFRSGSSIPKSQRRTTDIYGGDEKTTGNVFFDRNKNATNILKQRLSAGMPDQGTILSTGATSQSTPNVSDTLLAALGFQLNPLEQTPESISFAANYVDKAKQQVLQQLFMPGDIPGLNLPGVPGLFASAQGM
jgi:hypothetical protein